MFGILDGHFVCYNWFFDMFSSGNFDDLMRNVTRGIGRAPLDPRESDMKKNDAIAQKNKWNYT